MTEWLDELALPDDAKSLVLEKWRAREDLYQQELLAVREEAAQPLRIAGLVPGEARDGLPDTDGFLAGLFY